MIQTPERRQAVCLYCDKIMGLVLRAFEGELKCTNCGSINHFHKTEEPTQ